MMTEKYQPALSNYPLVSRNLSPWLMSVCIETNSWRGWLSFLFSAIRNPFSYAVNLATLDAIRSSLSFSVQKHGCLFSLGWKGLKHAQLIPCSAECILLTHPRAEGERD